VISEYYLGFFKSLIDGQLSVILMNTLFSPVNFTLEAPVVGLYHAGVIDGYSELILSLPFGVAVFSNDTQYKGVYIRADSDTLIVIGQSKTNNTSDTFLALPYKRSSAVTEYLYYGISVPGYSSSYQSAILIVGTEDNITMKLTVAQTVTTNFYNTLYAGSEYSFVINRLQTFYIRSTGDLTGTKIVTDRQVSVFSGHELAQIPQDLCCGDQLIEQVPPVTSWGRVFYTMPLASRTSYILKILASYNLTRIDLYCNNLQESHTINEGQHYTKILSQQEYCVVHSNKPVLVAQFSRGYNEDSVGDPMMVIVPDVLQFSNSFPITTIRNTSYRHYVNLIVLAQYYQPDMIYLISGGRNVSLSTQEWVPIRVKHTTVGYATQLNISEGVAEIIHTNETALMATIIYGFTELGSYGNPGRPGNQIG